MTQPVDGYSLNLFTLKKDGNVRNFLSIAKSADTQGNRNGYLDGNEISIFKNEVKKAYGIDFNFEGISKGSLDSLKQNNTKEYEKSLANVTKQEDAVDAKRDKLYQNSNDFAEKINKKFPESYNAIIRNCSFDGKFEVFIVPKKSVTLGQLKSDLNISDGKLISKNPKLKSYLTGDQKPNWWERHISGEKTNYDQIKVPQGIYIELSSEDFNK